jgi:hypothetical protein
MIAGRIAGRLGMNITYTKAYREAFGEYLRKGTPIRRSLKQAATSDRYVWRTQRDGRVRLTHLRNDGRIFPWAEAPLAPAAPSAAKVAGKPTGPRPPPILVRRLAIGLAAASCALALIAAARWIERMQASVTLPNALVLARAFDWTLLGRDDLLAADGRTLLARDVETVCFDDRYVWVRSRNADHTGLYDAAAGSRIEGLGYPEAMEASGLGGGSGCAGYYLGMVGPGLLYDGNEAPFLPPCDWRNVGNGTLEARSWFDRPCAGGRRR